MKETAQETLNAMAQIIYDKKGSNLLALDVRGLSSITDYLLIAEGNVDRHVISLAKALIDQMEEKGHKILHVEGLKMGDWVVLDYGSIIVHLFMPGLRQKYSLEKLWTDSKIVDLKIDLRLDSVSKF